MTKTLLCKDCKHYRRNWWKHFIEKNDYWDICMRLNYDNPVSGIPNHYRCGYERTYEYLCGPDGKFFERR